MSIVINYNKNLQNKNFSNIVFFVNEKFNISPLKKHLLSNEFSYVSDLLKSKDIKQKILSFDLNSKKKIILVSLKEKIKSSEVENLGAKFYNICKNFSKKLERT